jgi:hypothetical protein
MRRVPVHEFAREKVEGSFVRREPVSVQQEIVHLVRKDQLLDSTGGQRGTWRWE